MRYESAQNNSLATFTLSSVASGGQFKVTLITGTGGSGLGRVRLDRIMQCILSVVVRGCILRVVLLRRMSNSRPASQQCASGWLGGKYERICLVASEITIVMRDHCEQN